MEWWLSLIIIFGSLLVLMATGLPIFVCFLAIATVGVVILWGGGTGLHMLVLNIFGSISKFTLLPIPLFILMGEIMFRSGVATDMVDAVDMWLGRLPGRLSLLAVGSGTVLATLTGSVLGAVGLLGRVLVPEMEKRGYKKPMSLGPILGSGGLATMIPPSMLAVILGVIGEISIGSLLIAIILPGLLMATLYSGYIIIRCWLQPSIAPPYTARSIRLIPKLAVTAKYLLPVGIIIFCVTGVIFLGIATPSEAAATGAIACFVVAAAYGRLSWKMVQAAVEGTLSVSVMILMIILSALVYTQILSFSGATQGLVRFTINLPVAPMIIFAGMQFIGLFLGMFLGSSTIIMLFIPIAMPVIHSLGLDPLWFGVIFLVNIEIGMITPPHGQALFVMKSVATSDTTFGDCVRAALPFIGLALLAMVFVTIFPQVALWLPNAMR